MTIKLGTKVRDTVTGFTGIATSRTEYLNGCFRYGVTPPLDKDGKLVDASYFDEMQLEVVADKKLPDGDKSTGGPRPSPRDRENPR